MDIRLQWISPYWYMGCDQDCKVCFLGAAKDARIFTPIAERAKQIELFAKYGTEKFFIAGGNPTLDPFIEETLALIKSRGMGTEILSNSWDLSGIGDKAKFLENIDDKAATFFGATAETHDALSGAAGSFERLCNNLKTLRAFETSFTAIINATAQNKDSLYDIIRGLRGFMRLNKVWVQRIMPYGNALKHGGLYLKAEDADTICAQLERARDDFDLEEISFDMGAPPCLVNRKYHYIMEPYKRGISFFALDHKGRLFGESFDITRPEYSLFGGAPITEVEGDLIAAIRSDARTLDILGKRYMPDKCRKCPRYGECFGGYPVRGADGSLAPDSML